MRIEYLYYFVDIAKTQSISNSAKRLFISQQGLSRAIQSLEKEFNIPLLHRIGNTISLTKAGKAFAATSEELLEVYEKLRNQTVSYHNDQNATDSDSLFIFATPFVLNNVFPLFNELIDDSFYHSNLKFLEKHPLEILSDIKNTNSNSIYLTNIAEYALKLLGEHCEAFFEPLIKADIMVKVSKTSPYANKKFFTKKEIADLPLAFFKDEMLNDMVQTMLADYAPLNIAFQTTNLDLLRQKVQEDKAVGFTDSFSQVYSLNPEFTAIPIQDTESLYVGFIFNKNVSSTPAAKEFLEFMRNAIPMLCSHFATNQLK